jgi:uncharacterized protein (DUF433 family)
MTLGEALEKLTISCAWDFCYFGEIRTAADFSPSVPIWVDPERMNGAPCFTGTRVPVDSLFTNLESGLSLDQYLDCFPDVTREQAVAVLEKRFKGFGRRRSKNY